MKREKFDIIWKLSLAVILVIATTILFYELHFYNKESALCVSHPFVWGAKGVASHDTISSMECACEIIETEGHKYNYYFNQDGETQPEESETSWLYVPDLNIS